MILALGCPEHPRQRPARLAAWLARVTGMPDDDLTSLAFQAYLYGFPLVFNLDQVRRFVTTGAGSTPQAPYNRLSHSRGLAGPEDTPATQDQPRQKSLSATGIDQRGPSPYVSPQASFADTLRQGIAVVESTLKRPSNRAVAAQRSTTRSTAIPSGTARPASSTPTTAR